MRFFTYKAIDADGKAVRGTLEAEDEAAVRHTLEDARLYPFSIRPGSSFFAVISKLIAGRKVKRIEIIEFAQNLSVMLHAGIPIMTAMSDIIESTENRVFADILLDVKQDVERGSSFNNAIDRHRNIFPDIFIRLVRVGEETGRFDNSLAEIADHLKRVEELISAIKHALIYPVFAIVSTLGALMFWMLYVLPKLVDTMKGLGVKLPLLTRALIASSDLCRKYWYLMIILPVLAAVTIKLLKRRDSTRYYIDKILLTLPITKLIIFNKVIAMFAEQMRILVVSGMTIDRSINLAADVIGNEVYRRSLLRVRESVINGAFISDCLKAEKIYPILVVRMVSIGETSGTLDTQFGFLSDHYRTKLNNLTANLGKIIEPVIIIVVGLMFALIILGLMLPIYDLVSNIGKGGGT